MEIPKTIIVNVPNLSGTSGRPHCKCFWGDNIYCQPYYPHYESNWSWNKSRCDIEAAIENPIEYGLTIVRVKGMCLPVRRYSITRISRIAACDIANPVEFLSNPPGTHTAINAAAAICNKVNILCPKSSVSNLEL